MLLLLFFVGIASPQEAHAPWTPAISEGTPIQEYTAVSLDDRGDVSISIVEDLAITPRGDDPNYLFYRPLGIALDSSGRIFVLDAGNHRIQVYDANGEFLRTLGGRGSGPGQLARPLGIAIFDDRVVVYDFGNARLSIWNVEGEYLGDRGLGRRAIVRKMTGTTDGGVVLAHTDVGQQTGSPVQAISYFSLEDGETVRLFDLPRREGGQRRPIEGVAPAFAVSESTVYVTATLEYQVVALATSGEAKWAMRIPWKRLSYPELLVTRALELARRRRPDTRRSDLLIPDSLPALSSVQVDGHGHLYVFLQPAIRTLADLPSRDLGPRGIGLPVDVYTREGEQLATGVLTNGFIWQASHEDYVYGVRTDPDTSETVVARYRLVEEF